MNYLKNEVNKEDLSRYESMIEEAGPCEPNESEEEFEEVNSSSSSTTSSNPTDSQPGCFVKINLNGRSLVKSAPKRGAPTKAQRKRKLKENETKQRKKAKLDDGYIPLKKSWSGKGYSYLSVNTVNTDFSPIRNMFSPNQLFLGFIS
ncbi:hypothetical protein BpHYR1_017991 [Brachionus plicatilis]|uniref:Uncharacterized protein n=1 Tax=Brachionus plicatilis TaxID=10195 RepID=A0A3M7PK34_BRAPC|nr:hypothetical protein BpHYR1_017991 [Brachionus plicatilis]